MPTWRALIAALKARAIDEQVLAEELEMKLSLSRQPSADESKLFLIWIMYGSYW